MERIEFDEPESERRLAARERQALLSIPWQRITELARELESEYGLHQTIDLEAAAKLARAVLLFQSQLLGAFANPHHAG